MSGREWKPGDVASIDGEFYLRTKHGWLFASKSGTAWSHAERSSADQITAMARPLVVIDPEDHEQVGRLVEALFDEGEGSGSVGATRAALRTLIAPPKPDEPTGLGAVVEDAEGHLWFRMTLENQTWPGEQWQPQYGDVERWSKWSDIDAVKVLSEGVQP